MKTIDRKTAALLWANEYKLVDREGVNFNITNLTTTVNDGIVIELDADFEIAEKQIGTDYFVICRNYEHLTKEIEPGVVPLEVLTDKVPEKELSALRDAVLNLNDLYFTKYATDILRFSDIEKIFDKLYSYHFKPSSLPDEACKFIELNQPPKTI